jgi:hypothetical protein
MVGNQSLADKSIKDVKVKGQKSDRVGNQSHTAVHQYGTVPIG